MPRKPFKPSVIVLALVGIVGVLAAAGAFFANRPAGAAKPEAATAEHAPRPALAVTVTQPVRSAIELRLPANGNIAAWQEAVVGAESNGLRLTEVRVNVGDAVKKGQVLATFAAETVQADVAQARASLLEARASAAEAAANAERARTLTQSGALSSQQIQQYATASETAQARVEAAQAALNAQQVRLRNAQVLAPDSGVISSRTATVGAVVNGGAELFRMVTRGRLEWRAEVTSSDLPRIRPGQKATVTAASGAQVQGTVRMVAPTVDPQTRNGLVYVDLPSHPDIRAGTYARGDFQLGAREALTVPQAAVVVRDGFSSVFEVAPDGRVAMRRVQTGQRVGDRVEVASGLAEGTRIVERGGAFLNDGDLVRVEAAPAVPGSAPNSVPNQAPAPIPSAQPAIK